MTLDESIDTLAAFHAEQAAGIAHDPERVERMAALQAAIEFLASIQVRHLTDEAG